MLWVDKHRPRQLKRLSFHGSLSKRLTSLGSSGNITHMLFYGPSGAGKRTRVMALLREMYGPAVFKMKLEFIKFENRSGRKLEITAAASAVHTDINASDVGRNDHYAVKTVIKQMANTRTLGIATAFLSAASSSSGSSSAAAKKPGRQFRVLILTEADKLTKEAQQALRRIMEQYAAHCRLILLCQSTSKVIEAVRSRCLCIRVAAPTHQEICGVLKDVLKKEMVHNAPLDLLMRIAVKSGRNLRRALLMLEACKAQQQILSVKQEVHLADWEEFIATLANSILTVQSPTRLKEARNALYQLLTNCIPGAVILRTLTKELLKQAMPAARHAIVKAATTFDLRLQTGAKDIFHLEAFVARVMMEYKALANNVEW